ncbi:hypothetical protein WR25_11219, partial [Diploscapter pachys]
LKYNDLSKRIVIFFFFQPADGGQQLTATTSWTSLTVTITGTASISNPGPYSTKTYWIVKPAGYSYVEFQYVSFSSAQTKFSPGCRDLGLELKYLSNQQLANPRVCSDAWNGLSSSSPLATTPIVAYTSTISATFVLQFRATNTNVTEVKPPPPSFLSSNVYKHVHIDIDKHVHIDIYKHVHIDVYNYYYNQSLFRKFGSISSMW